MTADSSKARVLVVDDDAGILRGVARVLGRRYELHCTQSPTAALSEGTNFGPDLAILDIRMREMNGFELMRELRARLSDLDVILMTGSAEEPDANLIRAVDEGAFYFIQKPFDRRVLLALVARCLELRLLRTEKQQYTKRLEQELEEARRFQLSLLPPEEVSLPDVALCARYLACAELAGDFFDYVIDGDDTVALIVADVVGHGASAAMMTGIVKSAFRSSDADSFDPSAVVRRVKESMRVFDAGKFVTLICARLNRPARELTYVNAGHPSPILRSSGRKLRLLESTGPLISSAFVDETYARETVELFPRDFLFCYTDGLTEAQGPNGQFGRERLISLISGNQTHGQREIDHVLSTVTEFVASRPFYDDITILGLELKV
jgi:sigma-B regulation protein RsbU (phosphoserine phosphatase)